MTKISNLYSLTNYIDVNSNGNVVIAAPTSGLALDVTGTSRITGAASFSNTITSGANIEAGGTNALLIANSSSSTYFGGLSIRQSGTERARFAANTDDGAYVYAPTFAGFSILSNAGTHFRITTGGNVGIGATAPSVRLEVRNDSSTAYNASTGTTNRILNLRNATSGTGNNSFINFITEPNGEWYVGAVSKANFSDFVFMSRDASYGERLRITSSGNVGIGTTNPEARLMINGDWADMTGTITYSTNTKGIILNQDGGGGQGMGLWFRQAGLTAGIGSTRVSSGDWATDLRFYTHPSSTTNQNTLFERMRINSEGNVGIGTSSPVDYTNYRSLHIMGSASNSSAILYLTNSTSTIRGLFFTEGTANRVTIGSQSNHDFTFLTNDTERMRITSGGNVGIGTTSPSNRLSVFESTGTTTSTMDFSTTGNAIKGHIGMFANNFYITSNWFYNGSQNADNTGYAQNAIGFDNAGFMTFQTSAAGSTSPTERMRIRADGNVGVGTTGSSSIRLIVCGSGTSSAAFSFVSADVGGNTLFGVKNNGSISMPNTYNFTTSNAANLFIDSGEGLLYRSTSSLKYKTNVRDYDKGLDILSQMRPVYYEGIGASDSGKVFAGLIAEEIHDLGLTEFVQYAEDGTPDALAYQNMVSLLIKGMQELKAELDTLKNK